MKAFEALGKSKQSKLLADVQEKIAHKFLSLYRLQLGIPKTHPADLECMAVDPVSRTTIYQLTIDWQGKRNRKRMTIGPLGENSGGRSLCFKVIYDDILVIKVPANPIRHFNSYVASVAAEKRITSKVGQIIPCIVPSVAAMVKRIPAFPVPKTNDPDRLERASIRWLETYVIYQDFVQIDGTFIYVMELSESQFLSKVLTDMHDVTKLLETEMNQQMGLTMDFAEFEHRYGSVDVSVWLGINTVYAEFERLVEQMKHQTNRDDGRLAGYRVRDLFGRWLSRAGKKNVSSSATNQPGTEQPATDQPVTDQLGTDQFGTDQADGDLAPIFARLDSEYSSEIKAYHKVIEARMQKRAFDRNRHRMGSIIGQLLDLLAKLELINLVVRDLKPDNLFLDPSQTQSVTGDSESIELESGVAQIGLIDMETAVLLPEDPDVLCRQPLLGGTPPYATPLNFAKNKMLVHFYPDLLEVLRLQDWYAVVAMVYGVVVGKLLFRNAGRSIVSIVDTFQRHDLGRRTFGEALRKGSRVFWSIAVDDFMGALAAHEYRLKQVYITVPPTACRMLQVRIRRDHKTFEKKYQAMLEKASRSAKPQQYNQSLENLKRQLRQQVKLYDFFEQTDPQMTAYHLMHFMFNIVFRNLYRPEWGRLIDEPLAQFEKSVRKATLEVTSLLPS